MATSAITTARTATTVIAVVFVEATITILPRVKCNCAGHVLMIVAHQFDIRKIVSDIRRKVSIFDDIRILRLPLQKVSYEVIEEGKMPGFPGYNVWIRPCR